MPVRRSDEGLSGILSEGVIDTINKIFLISAIAAGLLFLYLMYGLFSGTLADVAGKPQESQHALGLVNQFSTYLNVSLVVALLTSILLYYEESVYAFTLLGLSAFLAFGIQFILQFFAGDSAKLTAGDASKALMHELMLMAMMIGAPGILMMLRAMGARFLERREGEDLTTMSYGANVPKEDVPKAAIPILAKCWQLPFCRAGIRKGCPIFLAKTKCWKERVGCMCEENIILLAMGGTEQQAPVNMTKEMGFVPIGDLLTKGAEEKKATIQTRPGPKGIRIPVNPHITDVQKRDRCRNCIIYNEHQRLKYSFFSVPVTLSVPVLVFFQFDTIRNYLAMLMNGVDKLIGHVNFTGDAGFKFFGQVQGNLIIDGIIIGCLTLVVMTWAQRFLEYCIFKIKI